jgi:hypothetical protein
MTHLTRCDRFGERVGNDLEIIAGSRGSDVDDVVERDVTGYCGPEGRSSKVETTDIPTGSNTNSHIVKLFDLSDP